MWQDVSSLLIASHHSLACVFGLVSAGACPGTEETKEDRKGKIGMEWYPLGLVQEGKGRKKEGTKNRT
jgi:hypothetical protein